MIEKILKGSAHRISLFTPEEIAAVNELIYVKDGRDAKFMRCQIRGKEIQLKPEEVVRQLFIYRLLHTYAYNAAQIKVEHGIHFGREVKRADIVIFEKDRPAVEYIIVEVKKPKLKDGKEQLRSYCNATGATMGVWTNGESISFYHRRDPNYFEDIPDIPRASQKLRDILTQRWTIDDLTAKDRLVTENKTLSALIVELEDEVLANAGVDVFEEIFKLIFTKLYDEKMSTLEKPRALEFRNYGDTDAALKETIQNLFDAAKGQWAGVFAPEDKIKLTPSHLSICISSLQNVKLFNSNLEIIDEAFEYLMSKSQKGEKGQYFTPRYVIDMCVKMLNPKITETMIDTAAGSCGFPVHTIFHVCGSQFTAEKKSVEHTRYVGQKVFAIDFDEKAVRVARTLNLIAGDGKTNVLWLNTLDYDRWDESTDDEDWQNVYMEGWIKLRALRAEKKSNCNFRFDIVMANPPFAGDIKETRVLHKYELAKNSAGKYQSKVGRDILFIERNLQFLKPGGRMAIVLPQGRFNNSSDKYIRDFIAERCRILAVIGLHGNVFKPHTGTKTSVLFVQKWDDTLCPRRDDYPVFMATMRKPSKDNSGVKIYAADANGNPLRDAHNHQIVDHDLFNHEGLTGDGIAEAFIEFAKREHLSFFAHSSFNESRYAQLLEELECTEIWLSEIDADLFRLEAEYYQKRYLALASKLIDNPELGTLANKIECGPFGSNLLDTEYLESGVLVVRPFNLKNLVVENDNLVYISPNLVTANNLKLYGRNTLLFSRVGDIKIGVLNRDKATISPNIIAVDLKDRSLAKFLAVFFSTYAGFTQIARQLKVSAQPTISTDIIKNLKVFLGDKLVTAVIKIFDMAQAKLERADEVYHAAEEILAQALGLNTFKPSDANIAVVSFAEMFGGSGRLDAEYYMPKYKDELRFLERFPITSIVNEFDVFKNSGTNYAEGVSDVGVVKTKQVTNHGINIDSVESYFDKSACIENRSVFLANGDVVFAAMGVGSLGKASIFLYDGDMKFVTDSTLRIYRAKNNSRVRPAVLCLFLQSQICQDLIYRYVVGSTGIINIYDADIARIPIPILDESTQLGIVARVEESFALRAESERLLGLAKAAVELAIERGEAAAVAFIEGNLYNAGVEKI